MILAAPAKFNLRLRVLGGRPDGYHEIETHLLLLELADSVEVMPGGEGIRLTVEGRYGGGIPAGEDNLCWQAARAFFDAVRRPADVAIRLEKNIPTAAGLGGGSSDAAAVLLGLNARLASSLERGELLRLAAVLGSDVPFFVSGSPSALGVDRGQNVEPKTPPPRRPALILAPGFGVSAADAYRWWAEDGRASDDGPREGAAERGSAPADWPSLERRAVNDLAPGVERRHPELAAARRFLAAAGSGVALLCGSGSCVIGVFRSQEDRDAARSAATASGGIAARGWDVIDTWTVGAPVPG